MLYLAPDIVPAAAIRPGADAFAAGMALLVAGIGLRAWASRTLGRYFTFTVMVSSDQPVITAGPYRVLRHPSYTGILLAVIGDGLASANWADLLCGLFLVLTPLLWRIHVEEKALKAPVITEAASVVAAIPEVRQALMNFQRQFATKPPGAVLDGRDIGTVIAPGADVKLFVVASPEVRAARRVLELRARGEPADQEEVLADLLRRDERDSRRTAAPLKAAPDAHLLDTTHLSIDAAFRAAVDIIEAVRTGRKRR